MVGEMVQRADDGSLGEVIAPWDARWGWCTTAYLELIDESKQQLRTFLFSGILTFKFYAIRCGTIRAVVMGHKLKISQIVLLIGTYEDILYRLLYRDNNGGWGNST